MYWRGIEDEYSYATSFLSMAPSYLTESQTPNRGDASVDTQNRPLMDV